MRYSYRTQGTCAQRIDFDLDGDKVSNVVFQGGCAGNLTAIPILVEGMTVGEIEEKLAGVRCGMKATSCPDQLAKAVRAAYDQEKE